MTRESNYSTSRNCTQREQTYGSMSAIDNDAPHRTRLRYNYAIVSDGSERNVYVQTALSQSQSAYCREVGGR